MTEDELRRRLDGKTTEELVALLRDHDVEEWRPEVFPLAESILQGRGIEPPAPAPVSTTELDTPREAVVAVGWFRTVPEADALRSALLAAGFRAAIRDEYTLLIDQSLVPAYGGVQLTVPETEAEAARQFLAAEATQP